MCMCRLHTEKSAGHIPSSLEKQHNGLMDVWVYQGECVEMTGCGYEDGWMWMCGWVC